MSKLTVKNRYGQAPISILNDENLSFKAKGLWVYIQSKPDNWNFSVNRICQQSKEGKESIQAAIKELELGGYLIRKAIKDNSGRWNGYDYLLLEAPFTEEPLTENQSTENPVSLSKIDNSKIDTSKIDNTLQSDDCGISKEISLLLNEFKIINPNINFGNKTDRNILESLIKRVGFDKALATIKYAIKIQGEQYSPVITTPRQFDINLGKLMIYYRKNNNKLTPTF